MSRLLTLLLLVQSSLWMSSLRVTARAATTSFNTVSLRSLPPLAVGCDEGVSAPFIATVNGRLWVGGGCNFPHRPAAEGGEKVYYAAIYELDGLQPAGRWRKVGSLPRPLAYGVSMTVPEGAVWVGGCNAEGSRSEAWLVTADGQGLPRLQALPSLPVALDQMGGAYGGGYLYVAGGQTNGCPSQAAFRLAWPGGKCWERLPDLPGRARLQPAAAVQNGAAGACLYVMGGFYPSRGATAAATHTAGLYLHPVSRRWMPTAPMKPWGRSDTLALVGAQAVASGCAHVIGFGGVDRARFDAALNQPDTAKAAYLSQPVDWYRFRRELLVYHTLTDTWALHDAGSLLARAGAAVVAMGNEWIVVGGELKPGVRSSAVTAVNLAATPTFGALNWAVLAAYLVGMLLLGYYFMRREGGADDFFKGGGRIPWWAAGISIYATMLSAITYMAYPAKAYAADWTYYPMLVTILVVSFPVVRYYLPFFRRLKVTTAYEYLERRFNAATRSLASALFIVFMVARMALVLYLPSLALTAVTGIDLFTCIVLMGLVTIVYCTMGGVEAVVWGDVVQGFILVGGAVFAVAWLVWGTEGGVEGFCRIGAEAEKFRLIDWSLDYRSATFWVVIVGGMANNLISYTSDQTVIQRYLTTPSEASARRSILLNGVMSVFVSITFFAIGAGLYTFYKTHPLALDLTMAKTDAIFPFFMMSQLPQGVAGLLIAAIFAATMSTLSSNINSVATAFSVDFYRKWRPTTDSRGLLRVARLTCVVAGALGVVLALVMATWNIVSLLDLFQEVLGLLSSGLGGLFLMGIFFPRIGGRSALTGFVAGVAAVFVVRGCTEVSFLLYGAIGMVVSVSVGYAMSFVMKEPRHTKGLTWQEREP